MKMLFVARSSNEQAVESIRRLRRCKIIALALTILTFLSAVSWCFVSAYWPGETYGSWVIALGVVSACGAVTVMMRAIDLRGDIIREFVPSEDVLVLDDIVLMDYLMSAYRDVGPYYASDGLYQDQLSANRLKTRAE